MRTVETVRRAERRPGLLALHIETLESDLQKLRIEIAQAKRDEASISLGAGVVSCLLLGGPGLAMARAAPPRPSRPLRALRRRLVRAFAPDVMLNATGYVMRRHKIELAEQSRRRVAWVGVEMGDKITKGPGARAPRGR
jgi:hypothetical protein